MSSFRRWFPLEAEYRVRGVLNVGTAIGGQPPIVHVAGWKTASQWVRMVFSDPQLMRATGYRATYVRGRAGVSGLRTAPLAHSTLATPVYAKADDPLIADHYRIFAVVREPAGLGRSWLRTNLANHPSNADVEARRAAIRAMMASGAAAEDVLGASFDDGFADTLRILGSWIERANSDPSVMVTRFEDLTDSARSRAAFTRVFEHVGFGDHTDLIDPLLARYRKTQVAKVERLLRPAAERKYAAEPGADASVQRELSDVAVLDVMEAFAPDLLEPIRQFYDSLSADRGVEASGATA